VWVGAWTCHWSLVQVVHSLHTRSLDAIGGLLCHCVPVQGGVKSMHTRSEVTVAPTDSYWLLLHVDIAVQLGRVDDCALR
jgi:hypothetical protein